MSPEKASEKRSSLLAQSGTPATVGGIQPAAASLAPVIGSMTIQMSTTNATNQPSLSGSKVARISESSRTGVSGAKPYLSPFGTSHLGVRTGTGVA